MSEETKPRKVGQRGLGKKPKASAHPLYSTYRGMRDRCQVATHKMYYRYGGRGITVCEGWLAPNGQGFWNFLSDMGMKPEGSTLDRIDNDLGYSKENCKWSTQLEQSTNKCSNRYLTLDGVTQTVLEWSQQTGILRHTITTRIDVLGWAVEKALTKIPKYTVRS